MNRYTFLRWIRSGASGAVAGEEGAGRQQRRAELTASLGVDRLPAPITRSIALHGPGDVVGLDPAQIIRRVPEPASPAADAGVLAHIELDDPDFPWRYTPFHERTTADPAGAALRRSGTLTPWLTLVVVERRPGVSLDYRPGDPLPVLTIAAPAVPADELPKAGELHAWAHVQVVGDLPTDPDDLPGLLDSRPERTLARLVCPRLLAGDTPYLACLVPTFAAGRQAGLGEEVTATADERAWAPADTTVRLPVYDSWEFGTGPSGDFEALVRRLRRVRLDEVQAPDGSPRTVGRRPLDVTSPGFGLADRAPGTTVDLLGALHLDGDDALAPPADAGLAGALTAAVDVRDAVAPPVYGRWHAAAAVPRGSQGVWPTWLATVNQHPGLRVAAGLGTQVVQANQEAFMAACWNQVGEILRANQLLRQAQLGVGASTRIHRRHLAPLAPITALQLAGPALARLRDTAGGPNQTLRATIDATCLPLVTLSGAWRRLLRRRGPLVRRVERWTAATTDGRPYDSNAVAELLASGDRLGPPPLPRPAVLVTTAELQQLAAAGPTPWPPGPIPDPVEVAGLASAVATLTARGAAAAAVCTPPDLAGLADVARSALTPSVTVPRRARAQLRLPAGLWDPPERIDPVMVAPEITTPMYSALAGLGQDWLLPGLEHVPPDSVSALAANQVFVEAFLLGMNHEMGRELLWRGFPTDQRGTVFRHFWDERSAPVPPVGDIARIHEWPRATQVGDHAARSGTASDRFVLLIRGELLRRFPRATVLLVRSHWTTTGPVPVRVPVAIDATARLPIFSGRLQPDVTFLGFDVPAAEVRGSDVPADNRPGWFVVVQEQPTEPRFGVSAEAGTPGGDGRYGSWADLGASDLATVGGASGADGVPVGYVDLAATTTAAFLARVPAPAPPGAPTWDGRSDGLAAVLLRQAFRLYLHGSDVLPDGVGP